jgi:hypothetical protein
MIKCTSYAVNYNAWAGMQPAVAADIPVKNVFNPVFLFGYKKKQ